MKFLFLEIKLGQLYNIKIRPEYANFYTDVYMPFLFQLCFVPPSLIAFKRGRNFEIIQCRINHITF